MLVTILAGDAFAANCYLIASETTRRALLLDPGVQAKRILAAVEELRLSIACIVLTHAHIDHCSGLAAIGAAIQAPFAAYDVGDTPPAAKPQPVLPGLTFRPHRLPFPPDIRLKEGDAVRVDDVHLTVLHTPGHSADSLCLWGHGAVFTGDTLFKGKIGATLPGLLPGYDHQQLLRSIERKLLTLPDATVVYPGHGATTTIGAERKHNPMLRPPEPLA